jgi:hypothetical protein
MPTKQKSASNVSAAKQSGTESSVPDQPASPSSVQAFAPRRWTVTIPYIPPTVVEANDEADAWEKFKQRWGIVKSEHVPAISAESSQ